jgi:hypothetical protein
MNNGCKQRTCLMRLSNETTKSCAERPRGRGTSSQASSIIVITSKGAVRRQDLRYVQSIMRYIYDIMTFLVTRKKPSHLHSDLSHAINAKHLSSTQVQCNAMLMLRNALSSSGAMASNRSKFCDQVPKFWLQCAK